MMAEAVEDGVGMRRQRWRMMTRVDSDCGGGRQRHTRSGGRLQQGRDNGGEQHHRERSGDESCDGRRRQRQMTTVADDRGGG